MRRWRGLASWCGTRGLLFETLVVNPRLLELLLRLFDSSEFLTRVVLRRPQLIEEILRGGLLDRPMTVEEYLAGIERNDEGLEPAEWLRVYRRSQILRIFLRDVLELAGIETVHAEYTALADACVRAMVGMLGLGGALTVVALGKFGGSELSYGLDLDVIFVGGDSEPAARFIKAMTAITEEGLVFPVDARPDASGPHYTTLAQGSACGVAAAFWSAPLPRRFSRTVTKLSQVFQVWMTHRPPNGLGLVS